MIKTALIDDKSCSAELNDTFLGVNFQLGYLCQLCQQEEFQSKHHALCDRVIDLPSKFCVFNHKVFKDFGTSEDSSATVVARVCENLCSSVCVCDWVIERKHRKWTGSC